VASSTRLNVNIDPKLLEWFRAYAETQRTTMTCLIRDYLLQLQEAVDTGTSSVDGFRVRAVDGVLLTFESSPQGGVDVSIAVEVT